MSKRFRIQDAEPGMVLAYPVINLSGNIVLSEGTILTEKILRRLKNWQVAAIDILETNELVSSVPKTAKKGAIGFEKPGISELQQKFSMAYQDSLQEIENVFNQVRYMKVVPMMKAIELAGHSFRRLSLVPSAISLLYTLARDDNRIVEHSLNVAVIAGILGRWLNLPMNTLQELNLAALLHDIGKTQVPIDIANKKLYQLNAQELKIIKRHTIEGYKLLNRKAYHLPFSVLAGVLQHHEQADGSGYPLKLTSEKMHPFAKIILVADVYETLTSSDFDTRLNPFSAVEVMLAESFDILDPKITNIFLANTKNQLIGNVIRLSDGQEAVVIAVGRDISERPVVQTLTGEFIDLETDRHLNIADIIRT